MNPLRILGAGVAACVLASAASAQTTYFSEDFNGSFPPAGWSVVNENGHTGIGWQQSADLRAWHEDESQQTDDSLETGAGMVDLTSAGGSVYLHFRNELNWAQYLANHPNSLGNGVNDVNISTDGGATWTNVWTETRTVNGEEDTVIDLTSYAGQTIDVQFYFSGNFAQEWWVDDVAVNDDPNPRPDPPVVFNIPNLPGSSTTAPYSDGFESYGGTPPAFMALNAMDPNFTAGYADAWCDINGATFTPNGGTAALEMGGNPNSPTGIEVRNAMVLQINGSGITDMQLDAWYVDHGEEDDALDGVWVSDNGTDWYGVFANEDWGGVIGAVGTWENHVADLTGTPVDTSGTFYLMFGQDDNFPYANLDGIGVDDIVVESASGSGGGPTLTLTGTCPGTVTLDAAGLTASSSAAILWGSAGSTTAQGGPCAGTTVDIANPSYILTNSDANGDISITRSAPAGLCGMTMQVVDITTCAVSNTAIL